MINDFDRLEKQIDSMGLHEVWLLKPLIDVLIRYVLIYIHTKGSELIKQLQLPKGPIVGKVMDEQILWQIREKSSNVNDCIEYLRIFTNKSNQLL